MDSSTGHASAKLAAPGEQVGSQYSASSLLSNTRSLFLALGDIAVCRLQADSAGDLARIESESNNPPWSEAFFASEFDNRCALAFGAMHSKALVGFIVSHAVIDEAHIVNFGIAKLYRGKGVGRLLMRHLLLDLAHRDFRWITLEVRRSNSVAVSLYESLGFRQASVRERYYPDNQEDALLMTLDVDYFREQNPGASRAAAA